MISQDEVQHPNFLSSDGKFIWFSLSWFRPGQSIWQDAGILNLRATFECLFDQLLKVTKQTFFIKEEILIKILESIIGLSLCWDQLLFGVPTPMDSDLINWNIHKVGVVFLNNLLLKVRFIFKKFFNAADWKSSLSLQTEFGEDWVLGDQLFIG